jgi:hypothetical protein
LRNAVLRTAFDGSDLLESQQRAALNESKGYAERVQSLEAIPLATREMVLEDLVLTSP